MAVPSSARLSTVSTGAPTVRPSKHRQGTCVFDCCECENHATDADENCWADAIRSTVPTPSSMVRMSWTVGCLYNHLRRCSHEEGVRRLVRLRLQAPYGPPQSWSLACWRFPVSALCPPLLLFWFLYSLCTVLGIPSPHVGPTPPYARIRTIPLTCSFRADDGIRTRDPHLGNVKRARGQSTERYATRTFAYAS